MRPVFDEKAEVVQGFLPFHTLVISYYEGGESRTFYVAMDANDVTALRELLSRAERKEGVLLRHLASAGLSMIETTATGNE